MIIAYSLDESLIEKGHCFGVGEFGITILKAP